MVEVKSILGVKIVFAGNKFTRETMYKIISSSDFGMKYKKDINGKIRTIIFVTKKIEYIIEKIGKTIRLKRIDQVGTNP